MSDQTSKYFDNNTSFYNHSTIYSYDYYFLEFIKTHHKPQSYFLDIGGGSGIFAAFLINNCPDIEVTVLDPSLKMLSIIDDIRIKKVQGKLPDLAQLHSKYDYIHLKEVLHHVTGSSINKSKELLCDSLLSIKKYIKDNGFVFIHELFYESYLIPSLSRNMIFNLLTVQNKLKIKIPVSESLMGLSVCFYTRFELETLLKYCGFRIIEKREEYWEDTWKKRTALLKNWGRMLFILEIDR